MAGLVSSIIGRNHSKACLAGMVLLLCYALIAGVCFASVDTKAHWPVQVTDTWQAMYGGVSGIAGLKAGDSVGVFDGAGNCYGAGLYNGTYYFLSAFQEDTGGKSSADFSIPGFKVGNEVIFKVYSVGDGKEYTLKQSSGNSYLFTGASMYPPVKIDLVYKIGKKDGDENKDPEEDGGDITPQTQDIPTTYSGPVYVLEHKDQTQPAANNAGGGNTLAALSIPPPEGYNAPIEIQQKSPFNEGQVQENHASSARNYTSGVSAKPQIQERINTRLPSYVHNETIPEQPKVVKTPVVAQAKPHFPWLFFLIFLILILTIALLLIIFTRRDDEDNNHVKIA